MPQPPPGDDARSRAEFLVGPRELWPPGKTDARTALMTAIAEDLQRDEDAAAATLIAGPEILMP